MDDAPEPKQRSPSVNGNTSSELAWYDVVFHAGEYCAILISGGLLHTDVNKNVRLICSTLLIAALIQLCHRFIRRKPAHDLLKGAVTRAAVFVSPFVFSRGALVLLLLGVPSYLGLLFVRRICGMRQITWLGLFGRCVASAIGAMVYVALFSVAQEGGSLGRARYSSARGTLRIIAAVLEEYRDDHGEYPANLEQLDWYLPGPAFLRDPFANGEAFNYRTMGDAGKVVIWSLGPDEDDDDARTDLWDKDIRPYMPGVHPFMPRELYDLTYESTLIDGDICVVLPDHRDTRALPGLSMSK